MSDGHLPWGLEKDGLKAGVAKTSMTLARPKKTFKKKSRLQMHREEAERKEREAAAELEAVYADFTDSFDVGEVGEKDFVRAGTMEGGKFTKGDDGPGRTYRPGGQAGQVELRGTGMGGGGGTSGMNSGPGSAGAKAKRARMTGMGGGIDLSAMGGIARLSKKKKEPSQRELFLVQLKREQEERDARLAGRKAAYAGGGGGGGSGFDMPPDPRYDSKGSHPADYDQETTNLYVGNISPQITEDILWRQFSVFGAIASVKIMWPRTEEERARARNCGFVQYMERRAAERGKNALDGTSLAGFEMKIGWGKKVARPLTPMYPPGMGPAAGGGGPLGQTFMGMGGQPQQPTPSGPDYSARIIKVEPPTSGEVMATMDALAGFVAVDGVSIELIIKAKEHGNPLFRFLFKTRSSDHTYYRWRVFSLANGDTIDKWRLEPFQMYQLGSTWHPPACPIPMPDLDMPGQRSFAEGEDKDKSDADRDKDDAARDTYESERRARQSERERDKEGRGRVLDGQLSGNQRDQLEDMLRGLTVEAISVQDGMMWCLDHSEAANEIVEVMSEALLLPISESAIERKIARIYLVSDILHNSSASVPKASRFRTGFESKLVEIFINLREAMLAIPGRITMLETKARLDKLLDVWETWSIYTPTRLIELRSALTGKAVADVLDGEPLGDDEMGAAGAAAPAAGGDDDVDGEPLDDMDGEALDGDALDGEAIDGDEDGLDGEPLFGLGGYGSD